MLEQLPSNPTWAFVALAAVYFLYRVVRLGGPPLYKLATDFLTFLRTREANTAGVVQELLRRVETLEREGRAKDRRIAALETENTSLRAEVANLHEQLDRVDPSKP